MNSDLTVANYINALPNDRRAALETLRQVIKKSLPRGFEETISYGLPSFVVPHSAYPDGYHCAPELPLPFLSMASRKNFVALYHMGLYADPKLLGWFEKEWPKHVKTKLDMGKSCIRFKKIEAIPFDLIGELVGKLTVEDWIALYVKNVKS